MKGIYRELEEYLKTDCLYYVRNDMIDSEYTLTPEPHAYTQLLRAKVDGGYVDALDESGVSLDVTYELTSEVVHDIVQGFVRHTKDHEGPFRIEPYSDTYYELAEYLYENYTVIYDVNDFVDECAIFISPTNWDDDYYLLSRFQTGVGYSYPKGEFSLDAYTPEEIANADEEELALANETLIPWLIASQGYTLADLYDENHPSCFIRSLREEIEYYAGILDGMQLSFVFSGKFQHILDTFDGRVLHVPKTVNCGFSNRIHGSGSGMSIQLEQDLKVPLDLIDDITCEGVLGEVYGAIWNDLKGRK